MTTDDNNGTPAGAAEREPNAGEVTDTAQDKLVSLADDDDDVAIDADDARADDEGDADDDADAGESDDNNAEHHPPRRNRTLRYRQRLKQLRAELVAERQRSRPRAPIGDHGDLVEPRQADFPDDYLAYDRAMRDFQIRRALRDERRRDAEMQARADAVSAFRERLAGYNVRLEALKPRIPDFDEVLRGAGGTEIRDDVRDLVLGSSKGPLLAYYLAKNPNALDDINRMPPAEAARRIGNLEARIRGPNPATATKAKAPVTPPRGGASAPRALDPDGMSHEEYRKARADGRI